MKVELVVRRDVNGWEVFVRLPNGASADIESNDCYELFDSDREYREWLPIAKRIREVIVKNSDYIEGPISLS